MRSVCWIIIHYLYATRANRVAYITRTVIHCCCCCCLSIIHCIWNKYFENIRRCRPKIFQIVDPCFMRTGRALIHQTQWSDPRRKYVTSIFSNVFSVSIIYTVQPSDIIISIILVLWEALARYRPNIQTMVTETWTIILNIDTEYSITWFHNDLSFQTVYLAVTLYCCEYATIYENLALRRVSRAKGLNPGKRTMVKLSSKQTPADSIEQSK